MADPEGPDFSGLAGGEEQAAVEAVREVVNWYSAQLLAAHRAPAGDEEQLGELRAGREAALADQARLAAAGPEETARIAAVYAARLKELKEP
ncbi:MULTISPECIES: hypothetical protein [unclassified Streptomyces]|uniref:hypothetical protein n=1 Tax=unclassified Streptomyces TaxID=2593676 RepID=UPI00344E67B1